MSIIVILLLTVGVGCHGYLFPMVSEYYDARNNEYKI